MPARIRTLASDPRLISAAAVVAACLWSAWSTMDRYFLGDDFGYVQRFARMPFAETLRLFWNDWSGGIWGYALPELRPFAGLSLWMDTRLWGVNPLGFHLTNFVLYAVAALLVAGLVRTFTPRLGGAALAAGLIFALHPAHAEPVAWITGRVDLLGGAAYLAGLLCATRYLQDKRPWLAGAWISYFVGVFSKEFCLTLPFMVGIGALFFGREWPRGVWRRYWVLFGGYVVVVLVYWFCRHTAFGEATRSAGPLDWSAFGMRQYDYLSWMLPPFLTPLQKVRAAVEPAIGIWLGVLAVTAVGAVGLWNRRRPGDEAPRAVAFFGLAWYALATFPLIVATYFSPRHLFLATAGQCIAVAVVIFACIKPRLAQVAALAILILVFAHGYREAVRPWRGGAKMSERISDVLRSHERRTDPAALFVLDVPATHHGAWMWSWSLPHAVEPPFISDFRAQVLAQPETYFAPHLWQKHVEAVSATDHKHVVRLSVDHRGRVSTAEYSPGQFAAARGALLARAANAAPGEAWREFLSALNQ